MRTTKLLAAAALLAGLSNVAHASDASASECWSKAFTANDAAALSQCYAADAIMWFPGGSRADGREAIGAGYGHFLSENTVKRAETKEIGSRTIGDDRVAWGTYTVVSVLKATGEETTTAGRFVDVSRRIDGRWQYVVDHPSDDPAPAGFDAATALTD